MKLWREYSISNFSVSMMTSSNGIIFRVTGPLCGEFTSHGEFPTQRPVTRSFYVFFDLRLNKRLSKQSWGWRFETPSCSLWRHCNGIWLKVEFLITIEVWSKWLPWCRWHFQMHFLERKFVYLIEIWVKFGPKHLIDKFPYYHMASLSLDKLKFQSYLPAINSLRPSEAYMRQWTTRNQHWFR